MRFSLDIICLVMAVINGAANIVTLAVYACLWAIVFLFSNHPLSYDDIGLRDLPKIFLMYIVPFTAVVNIIFLVFLWKGICQTRPQYVKAYFVYSVAITVLIALISVVILCSKPDQFDVDQDDVHFIYRTFIGFLVGCVLHAAFLVVVHLTYRKVVEESRCSENNELI